MAICKNCGKKGLFLHLNARGLCADCAKLAQSVPSSTAVTIGIDGINKGREYAAVGHMDEEQVCRYFIDELVKRGKERDKFKIEHRAQDYTSLVYGLSDFMRVKVTSNVKWISIGVGTADREKYKDSPLFQKQTNKNEIHWKSYYDNDEDLKQYVDIAAGAFMAEVYGNVRDLSDKEKEAADYLYDLFLECGAAPEDFYLYILSNEFELIFHSQYGSVRVKAYAKKKGGYIIDNRFDEHKIAAVNGKLAYVELNDLDFLKEKYIPNKIKKALDDKYVDDMSNYIKYKQ